MPVLIVLGHEEEVFVQLKDSKEIREFKRLASIQIKNEKMVELQLVSRFI